MIMSQFYSKSMLIIGFIGVWATAHAGTPVWTFSAPNPAQVIISAQDTATVKYIVTNQSAKPKNLIMKATPGLSASACHLATKGSVCTLTVTIHGIAVPSKGIYEGPMLCEQGNPNQCYEPCKENQLQVTLNNIPQSYLGFYVLTEDYHTAYSSDNGSSWNPMLNQMSGSFDLNFNSGITVDSNGALYMAMSMSGPGTLVYTSDGVNWSQTGALPDSSDQVESLFALNNTVYVGTTQGKVVYTTNHGVNWTAAGQPNNSPVKSLFVSSNGTLYAGTGDGTVFSSFNNGATWTPTQQKPDGSSIYSLASGINGALYAVTKNTRGVAAPLYSTNNGASWDSMGALPSGSGTALTFYGTKVYVGTDQGAILDTTNNGATWTTASSQPDSSKVEYLFINKSTTLSPLFVQAVGLIPADNTSISVTVKNLSNTTASNVRAQLPASLSAVIQDSSNCASVAPQGMCTLKFTSTQPYAPQNIAVVGTNAVEPISRVALAFSKNGYLVYNTDNTQAYVVDHKDVIGSPRVWSPINNNISGTSENDTSPCAGATDGQCNTQQIVSHYNPSYAYAAGLCYQSTAGDAAPGDWYLPSACELNGGVYLTRTTNSFTSCAPVITGIFSLYSLGFLSNLSSTDGFYWSSTQDSSSPTNDAWYQFFSQGKGGYQLYSDKQVSTNVRCVRTFSL